MTNSIRIGRSNTIKIEVNDDGEYIEINPDDKRFTLRLKGFINSLKSLEKETAEKADAWAKLGDNATDDDALDLLEYDAQVCEKVKNSIDELFGDNTCRKVFGEGVLPSLDNVREFINAITPYFAEAIKSRKSNIGKRYSANRRGGR